MFGKYVHIKGETEKLGKYYCEDCKQWFDTPHVIEYDEPRGEYWGIPCSEHMIEWHCPYCNEERIIDANSIILDNEDEDYDDYMEAADWAFSKEE